MMYYQKNAHIDFQPLDDQLVALDLSKNAYYSLNDTARFFIENALAGLGLSQIIEKAQDDFAADGDQIARDFEKLSEEIVQLGLLDVVDA